MEKVKIQISPKKAPASVRDLINPSYKIPNNIKFIPAELDASPILRAAFYIFLAIALLSLYSTIKTFIDVQNNEAPIGYVYSGIVIIFLSSVLSFRSLRSFNKSKKSQVLYENGLWKKGVFLLKNSLVVYLNKSISIFPRDSIVKTKFEEVGQKETRRILCYLIYKVDNSEEYAYLLPPSVKKGFEIESWLKK